jgi:hypothetical protein
MNKINDSWFDSKSFKAFKRPVEEKYSITSEPGVIETLEGPVEYGAGYYIMIGPKGEQYPITSERFKALKDDLSNGRCLPKKVVKLCKVADHTGTVETSWGQPLHYNPGVDVIVQHGPGDFGVVKADIFEITYERV